MSTVIRRRAGLLLVGGVVLLIVVVGNLRPHLRAGSAQAVPVPGPPAIGDCAVDPFQDFSLGPQPDPATAGGTLPVYPRNRLHPCSGARYGEVVGIIDPVRRYVAKGDEATGQYLDDPNFNSCVPLLIAYLGIPEHPLYGLWSPSLGVDGGLTRPSIRQEAAGQRWAACVVAIRPPAAAMVVTSPRYTGSIRNALQTGRERNQLGNCISNGDWNGDLSTEGCADAHSLEVLGYGFTDGRPAGRAELESTCRQLVRQLTGMPDPTAGGALEVQIHAQDDSNVETTSPHIPANSFLRCGITTTGHRKLGGSLLALGQQPIPWV